MNEHLETLLTDFDRDDILLVPDNMKLNVNVSPDPRYLTFKHRSIKDTNTNS